MKRRHFSSQCLGLSATALWGSALLGPGVQAQGGPVEGRHYQLVNPPAPVSAEGKIEVIEFFWYGCPHCNSFEPILEPWVKNLPADVAFRRLPVAFRPTPFVSHQKLFYTLESMNLMERLHRKVFDELHLNRDPKDQRPRLSTVDEVGVFAEKNGVDKAQFLAVFNSFAISTKAGQAKKISDVYRLGGVPALGIHGRYVTDSQAGDMNQMLTVADFLIQKVRSAAPMARS